VAVVIRRGPRCACGDFDFSTEDGGVVLLIEDGFERHTALGCTDCGEPKFQPGEEN
jgi:hypothetical protein